MILDEYERNWFSFKMRIERKAKDRCTITRNNWGRLQEYHLEYFLKNKVNSPLSFLIRVKVTHPDKYKKIKGMGKMLHYYRQKRYDILSGKE